MATIDVGGGHGRKSLDHALPLVPFIDFLLCLISFLLITAVWSQMARVNADARVPGAPSEGAMEESKERTLHVEMKSESQGHRFKLVWKEGSRVLDTLDVPPDTGQLAAATSGGLVYPQLAKAIELEWSRNESRHFAPSDPRMDQIVLHTDNATPFAHVVAVIDAANKTQRAWLNASGETVSKPALNLTFAVN